MTSLENNVRNFSTSTFSSAGYGIAQRHGQRVDDRERDEHEQVGHLTHGHRLGAVAYDAEDGEKPQGEADLELDASQQEYQEEDAHADEHEREVVVPAPALGIIQEMDDTPRDKGVEREAQQQQLPRVLHVHQRHIQKFQIVHNLSVIC